MSFLHCQLINSSPSFLNNTKTSKHESESDSESAVDEGVVGAGTEKERQVSAGDALCCICLLKYRDGVGLGNCLVNISFMASVVINGSRSTYASCSLCKHEATCASTTNSAEPVCGSNSHEEHTEIVSELGSELRCSILQTRLGGNY